MSYALLFPGQAAQQVGMGNDFRQHSPAAEALFALADRETGLDLRSVVQHGPIERLTETRYAQPGVVTTSLAALSALQASLEEWGLPGPSFCAGHSVGELAAAAAAGAVDPDVAVHLVARRAEHMATLCERVDGTMAAVVGLDEDALLDLCERAAEATGGVVELANLNAPDQLVISGHRSAVEWLRREGPSRGARRIIPLNVGGPFHSYYMRPAVAGFAADLEAAAIRAPAVPLVLNRTARPTTDPAVLRRELAEQIASPVRWAESLRVMAGSGCRLFLEVGPGQVLAGLVRRTLPDATVVSIQDRAGLEPARQALYRLQEGSPA